MHDLYYELADLCETAGDEIKKANEKIKKAGGQISTSDLDYLDKLTHMVKSIKTTKAMMEAEEGYSGEDGYSGYMMDGHNASYRRGRGSNAKRDSMGRYASENRGGRRYYSSYDNNMSYDGRSYDQDMVSELRELMEEAPNNQMRQKFQQFITEIERMK